MPSGTREAIARETGIYAGVIRGYFNADDERKSPHFQVLHIQAVLDAMPSEVGERVWAEMCSMREASRPVTLDLRLDTTHELGSMSKEVADVVVAHCQNKPVGEQLREIDEARRAIDRYESALKNEIAMKAASRLANDNFHMM